MSPLAAGAFITHNDSRDDDIMPDGERFGMVFPTDQNVTEAVTRPQINTVLNWFEELKEQVD